MKYIILLISIVSLTGLSSCSSIFPTANGMLDKIPHVEFDKYEYHRSGNVTSADITAIGGVINEDELMIESLHIKADYGPMVNFNILIEGYKEYIGE